MSTKESRVDQKNYKFNERPKSSGLYDANYEHDACGMGFISHLDGKPSRSIVDDGLTILERLVHRGGTGAEEDTGDGAGILMAMPDQFLRAVCKEEHSVELPALGEYAVAMAFLPRDEIRCSALLEKTEQIIIVNHIKFFFPPTSKDLFLFKTNLLSCLFFESII